MGRAGLGISIALLAVDMINAYNSGDTELALRSIGGFTGGILGGMGGAALGSFGGPGGTIVGGFSGGISGAYGGDKLGVWIYRKFIK